MDDRDQTETAGTDAEPERRDLRAEIGAYVSLTPFPATAGKLAHAAAEADAPDPVLATLRGLPSDQSFETARDLWLALDLEATNRF
jgi:hypothetical protein